MGNVTPILHLTQTQAPPCVRLFNNTLLVVRVSQEKPQVLVFNL